MTKYGLYSKSPEKLVVGRVLGLGVYKEYNQVLWKRDNLLNAPEETITHHQVFSWIVDWAFSDRKLVASSMQLPKEGGKEW